MFDFDLLLKKKTQTKYYIPVPGSFQKRLSWVHQSIQISNNFIIRSEMTDKKSDAKNVTQKATHTHIYLNNIVLITYTIYFLFSP